MKMKHLLATAATALLASIAPSAQASSYSTPKQEFRASWIATVYELDWPVNSQRASRVQKAQLRLMLDSLHNNNINAVCFQVRSMTDACYKSSYEPWSAIVTGTRGQAPDYDPLQYIVEQCHLRGMECHAWVNPYRYGTFSGQNITGRNTDLDKAIQSSGMLLNWYNSSTNQTLSILDPGQQQTIDRIVNVCKEIVDNYDIDGLLFDDYFYPNGIPTNTSAPDYAEWQAAKSDMTFGDWRRDNVNRMVKAVYAMIQASKPYVRFGIGPAGAAASSASVAAKYGVTPCPSSDWQYNGIFSDPLAWLNDKSIDYISPQIYWSFGHSTNDYGKLCEWWSKVAGKFGRQLYVSHSISSLKATSTGTAVSANAVSAGDVPIEKASGPNSDSYDEFVNEVEANRTNSPDGAPGSIFYSTRFLYRIKKGAADAVDPSTEFCTYLGRTVYELPALPPAMPWKQATDPGIVTGMAISGNTLSWTPISGVRYTVYALPDSADISAFTKDVKHLLGITYSATYTIPQPYATGYKFAVCAYDRFGNEWAPAFTSSSAVAKVDADRQALSIKGGTLHIAAIGAAKVTVNSHTTGGALESCIYSGVGGNLSISLHNLAAGAHIITAVIDGTASTIKFIK